MVYTTETTTVYIHQGYAFEAGGIGNIPIGASITLIGVTGNIPVHFHELVVTTDKGVAVIELIENPTITVTGTPFPTFNRNRDSDNVSRMQCYIDATVTGGTIFPTHLIHNIGGGAHIQGGSSGYGGEWVLKPNTPYAFRITNQSGSIMAYDANFHYYEVAL